tara:strand:+ start:467 stop:667 length:201 start_codon:yes stop_codon:yes gene_type:complete
LKLAREFSLISDEVFLISKVIAVFPGIIDDHFLKSKIMEIYLGKVIQAEKKIFGDISFIIMLQKNF